MRRVKSIVFMVCIAFMLILQTGCSGESENVTLDGLLNNDNFYVGTNEVEFLFDNEEYNDNNIQEYSIDILEIEEYNNLNNYYPTEIYFTRIDMDSIDLVSNTKPTNVPHGYIAHWYVRHISTYFPSRVPFTYREYDMALWLMQMLHAKGFDENHVRMQTFSHYDVSIWENYFFWGLSLGLEQIEQMGWFYGHETRGYSQNVIVTIPGQSTQTIIIGAHYDSLRYSGASDNASGVALLMENAQRMLNNDNYYTLKYVFFGAHEIGLYGAFYFYESLTQEERDAIVLYISADVLIEGPELFISTGYSFQLNQNPLSEQILEFVTSFSDTNDITIGTDWTLTGSDEQVFLYRGYTTMAFWGLCLNNFTNFLHSYKDCYEYISARFPGMIERTMNIYSLLLEKFLMEGI